MEELFGERLAAEMERGAWAVAVMSLGLPARWHDPLDVAVVWAGEIVLLRPCATDLQKVMPGSQEIFTELMAHDEQNGRLLVRSANQYWIFDSRMLSWQLIPDVTPNPYDLHWDNAAWQPDGELLAISRLNGRDASDGSTLYIIAGNNGQVIHTLPLTEASDQSAPYVDWLLPQELILGTAHPLISKLRRAPPRPSPPRPRKPPRPLIPTLPSRPS